MALTKASFSMIRGTPINVMDYFPIGFDTNTGDCTTYIQNAIDDAISENRLLYIPGGNYRTTAELIIDAHIEIKGDGAWWVGGITRIFYDGSIASVGVLKIAPTGGNINYLKFDGLCIDSNSKAAYGVNIMFTSSGAMTHPRFTNLSVVNFTTAGFRCRGDGGNQMSEFYWADSTFQSASATGGYGIVFENSVNCSDHFADRIVILGDPGAQLANAVFCTGMVVDNFTIKNMLTGQHSSYAVQLAGGAVGMYDCWNEGAALLSIGNSGGSPNPSVLVNCFDTDTTAAIPSVNFQTANKSLTVIGGNYGKNINVGTLVNATRFSIQGATFDSGNGIIDGLQSNLIKNTSSSQQLTITETLTGTPASYYISAFANLFVLTLTGNITIFVADSTTSPVTIIFKYTGAQTVAFDTNFKLKTAFTATGVNGKADVITFAGAGDGNLYEISRNQNITV